MLSNKELLLLNFCLQTRHTEEIQQFLNTTRYKAELILKKLVEIGVMDKSFKDRRVNYITNQAKFKSLMVYKNGQLVHTIITKSGQPLSLDDIIDRCWDDKTFTLAGRTLAGALAFIGSRARAEAFGDLVSPVSPKQARADILGTKEFLLRMLDIVDQLLLLPNFYDEGSHANVHFDNGFDPEHTIYHKSGDRFTFQEIADWWEATQGADSSEALDTANE